MATTLPDCMMPDGAEPCVGYRRLYEANRAMLAFLDRYVTSGEVTRAQANELRALARSEPCQECGAALPHELKDCFRTSPSSNTNQLEK